jgi:predicted regulator of Ras-like GTPase activity (Roadblock/LC7/MglB family)
MRLAAVSTFVPGATRASRQGAPCGAPPGQPARRLRRASAAGVALASVLRKTGMDFPHWMPLTRSSFLLRVQGGSIGDMGNTARRLRFIQDDIARVENALSILAQSCEARATVLFHKDGQLLASHGSLEITHRDLVSEAVAAAWGQLDKLSQALGGAEPPFVLIPMGQSQLRLSPLGFRFLLGIVFDKNAVPGSSLGNISFASGKLNEIFEEIDKRIEIANKISQDSTPSPPQTPGPA